MLIASRFQALIAVIAHRSCTSLVVEVLPRAASKTLARDVRIDDERDRVGERERRIAPAR
ncbi:MAG: hypothetical protein M5T61_20855 [Acidimicrobiia bacterium]|nr:hypothetical protein [Acidimicrobiia bacterium]